MDLGGMIAQAHYTIYLHNQDSKHINQMIITECLEMLITNNGQTITGQFRDLDDNLYGTFVINK